MAILKYKNGSSWVSIFDMIYPVGTIYSSYSSTSPATRFGGTWTAITGRFPYYNAGTGTGGSNTHSHKYGLYFYTWYGTMVGTDDVAICSTVYNGETLTSDWNKATKLERGQTNRNSGLSGAQQMQSDMQRNRLDATSATASTMPAYQTLYAWRRTA